jgi:tripartite-type tricarboxylate transporter receptor subunit TctC
MRATLAIALSCCVTAFAAPACAQGAFEGKQISIVVGFSPGGTYDAMARLYARHMVKYLPGKPTAIVRNMPGAGSQVAANHLYSAAPKDGTTLGILGGNVAIEPLLSPDKARYDGRRFAWIGGRSRDHILCLVWHTVPVRSFADLATREVVVGATGPGSRTLTNPRVLNDQAGARLKIISGYPGGNEITLALEKGEVEGYCGWALGSIKQRAPHWLSEGKVRPLVNFSYVKPPDLPNVPLAHDLARTETGREAIRFLEADSVLAWPMLAPPDMAPERVAELRSAFDRMMKDPEALADAARQGLEMEPVAGAELQKLVESLYAAKPEVIDYVRRISTAK